MAIPTKSCGRKFIHTQHVWQEPVLSVEFTSWPDFFCRGVETGPTEQEFLRGTHTQTSIEETSIEETADDAARRFALQLEQIKAIVYDKHKHINLGGTLLVPFDDLDMILNPED